MFFVLCVPGNRAVWPSAQCASETVSAAFPVFQRSAADQSALPNSHLSLLQQQPEQGHPGARNELYIAGHFHTGTCMPICVQHCLPNANSMTANWMKSEFTPSVCSTMDVTGL